MCGIRSWPGRADIIAAAVATQTVWRRQHEGRCIRGFPAAKDSLLSIEGRGGVRRNGLSVGREGTEALYRLLCSRRAWADQAAGFTTAGPHQDDLIIEINKGIRPAPLVLRGSKVRGPGTQAGGGGLLEKPPGKSPWRCWTT